MPAKSKRLRDDSGHPTNRGRKKPRLYPQEESVESSPNLEHQLRDQQQSSSLIDDTPLESVLPANRLQRDKPTRAAWLPEPDPVLSAYFVDSITVHSATKITKIVTRCLTHLGGKAGDATSVPKKHKGRAIQLIAKASAASKAITIAEIVKRERARGKDFVAQYTKLDSVVEEVPRVKVVTVTPKVVHTPRSTNDPGEQSANTEGAEREVDGGMDSVGPSGVAEDDSQAFEKMLPSAMRREEAIIRELEGKPKVRATPIITITLSDTGIPELRSLYGEQKPPISKSSGVAV